MTKEKKMNNCLFISYIMFDEHTKATFNNDPVPAIQTLKFGKSILRMLGKSFINVDTAGFCPIQDYPKGKKIFFGYHSGTVESFKCNLLSFINILGLKHITRFISLLVFCSNYLLKNRSSTVIFHGLHSPYLLVGTILKIFKIKVGVIITDESSLPLQGEIKVKILLKKIDSFFIQIMISKFDFGMALSNGLSDRYFQEVNYINFPGVVDDNFYINYNKNEMKRAEDTIFKVYYAGIISAEYGMDKLIDAILLIDWPIQLCCYGKGDQAARLADLSANDSRFFYGGFVSEDDLIGAMKNSDLLINARPSNTRLAKMSFPSKLLEYASTGKPVLTTMLPSIPSNIAEGFFYIDDESVSGIAKAIELVNKVGKKRRLIKGGMLKKNVIDNYSDKNLANYISVFLNENI